MIKIKGSFSKRKLFLNKQSENLITKYLKIIKTLVDQLALIESPLKYDDLIHHYLNGVGPNFKVIT